MGLPFQLQQYGFTIPTPADTCLPTQAVSLPSSSCSKHVDPEDPEASCPVKLSELEYRLRGGA